MKKLLMAALISALTVAMTGCTSETPYGQCVGIGDDHNAQYIYKTPAGNIVAAIVFSETIVVPAVVLISEFSCPVAKK